MTILYNHNFAIKKINKCCEAQLKNWLTFRTLDFIWTK